MSHRLYPAQTRRAIFAALAFTLAFGSAIAHDFKAGSLTIDHPAVSPTRGSVPNNAGYLTIISTGPQVDRLLSASSPDAARVEVHEHARNQNGMVAMRPVRGGVFIPARGRVQFAPGGLHLMIYSPKAPLRDGGYFPITLTFERAGNVDVVAMVETPSPATRRHAH